MIILKNDEKNLQLSANFRSAEFLCPCGLCAISLLDENLLWRLQLLRNLFGYFLTISSGYRCPQHNRIVDGSAKYSYHQAGMAADIVLPTPAYQETLLDLVANIFAYHYIKRPSNIVHVDIRKV